MEIKGKEIKGFQYADGVHWWWGDKEVAVIDDHTGDIEWCDRTFKYPEEVIKEIRKRRPKPDGVWVIDVRKISPSVTQGYYQVSINGRSLMTFGADKKINANGEWDFDIPDKELGRLVYATFWHPLDHVYHYSDKAKDVFKPNWRKDDNKEVGG